MARVDRERLPPLVASRWVEEPGSLEVVGVGANVVVRCLAPNATSYLRIVPEALRPAAEVEAATDYLRHLSAAGAPVCPPLASRAGRLVEVVACGGERFVASAVGAVPGRPIDPLGAGPEVDEAWGVALGALHAAAASYRVGGRDFPSWDGIWARTGARLAPGDLVAALPRFACMKALEMWAWAEAEWRDDVLPGGERRDERLPELRQLFASAG